MKNPQLMADIDAFLAETKMGEYRFGYLAAKNGRLVERLRAGRRVWPDTEINVRAFMQARRALDRSKSAGAAS